MNAVRLVTRRVEKPWGRRDLLPAFGDVQRDAEPIGEIWFEDPCGGDPELMVKYLFTSEKLSIQVHPDDQAAQQRGGKRGKEEAWVVLQAEPDAVIGIGLRDAIEKSELRAAAIDGSIEDLIDWRAAKAGDYYYSPAGTVHALGPGLKLIEVQQNVDLTYRLYDYGRPRELHLEDGIAVSNLAPYVAPFEPYELSPGRLVLAAERKFVLEQWTVATCGMLAGRQEMPIWLIPVAGQGRIGVDILAPGEVWICDGEVELAIEDGADLLIAYAGPHVTRGLLS